MINKKFEAYKIERELKRSGIDYEFKRFSLNEFGEPSEPSNDSVTVGIIKGLYHEQNSNIQITTGDTTQVRTKKIPMILCLYDDTASLALQVGDLLEINKKQFKVTGVTNIQEWNIISDISLEVVDNVVQN